MARMWCCLGTTQGEGFLAKRPLHAQHPMVDLLNLSHLLTLPNLACPITRKEGYSAHAAMYIMA